MEQVLQDHLAYRESDALHGWPVGPKQAPASAVAGKFIIERQHFLCPSKGTPVMTRLVMHVIYIEG